MYAPTKQYVGTLTLLSHLMDNNDINLEPCGSGSIVSRTKLSAVSFPRDPGALSATTAKYKPLSTATAKRPQEPSAPDEREHAHDERLSEDQLSEEQTIAHAKRAFGEKTTHSTDRDDEEEDEYDEYEECKY